MSDRLHGDPLRSQETRAIQQLGFARSRQGKHQGMTLLIQQRHRAMPQFSRRKRFRMDTASFLEFEGDLLGYRQTQAAANDEQVGGAGKGLCD